MIYHVFANRSNIGDWLSAKAIQKLLAPAVVTECLCDVPYIEETMEVLSKAGGEDLIIIGGGGLLMDYFVPFWEAFKPISQQVPFCIWGVGCCDLKMEVSLAPSALMEEIVAQSKVCYVRDELSRAYLSHCQLPPPVPCPSINLIHPATSPGTDLLHVVNYSTAGADVYEIMCTSAGQFAAEKGVTYRETNNRVRKNSTGEMDRVLSLYKGSGIVLSSALHGCILAVAMGLKVLAVSGDRKIEAFMEAVGLGEWVLDQKEVHLIPDRLERICSQAKPEATLNSIRQKNVAIADRIRSIMPGHPHNNLIPVAGAE